MGVCQSQSACFRARDQNRPSDEGKTMKRYKDLENIDPSNADAYHLAKIINQPKKKKVRCLVCTFETISLQMHKLHFQFRHKKLQDYLKNIQKKTSHQKIRDRVKKIASFKEIKKKGGDRVQYKGQTFRLIKHDKEYSNVQCHQDRLEGQLIWRYIFQSYPQAKYYCITSQNQEKNVRVIGYVLDSVS